MKSGGPVTMYVGLAKDLYRASVATGFEMKPDMLAWSLLAGLPKTFSTLETILEALKSARSSVDAILPKLLVHEQGFEESLKDKGGGGSDSAMAYENGNCELEVDREVVLLARKVKGIYVVNGAEKDTCFPVKKPEIGELWHRRRGRSSSRCEQIRARSLVNKALEDVFGSKGTVHQKTAPYNTEQNVSAERLKRDKDKTRAMLEDSGVPKESWAEAVVTANYTRNRTPEHGVAGGAWSCALPCGYGRGRGDLWGSGKTLIAYCDAECAGDVNTERSTTGYVFSCTGRRTENMKADIMTKALAPGKFKKFKREIGTAKVISMWRIVEIRAFCVRNLVGDVNNR
ncbi:hypothetical protein KFL_004940020 [Klebsormidium nitens]|uniref:Integrase catalytic domain-containing protein n=1 Tax=Klebsormidium nitens TaxID=105231 RepID=A0A1Y1IEY0_KLENI|nr:hypothetical protein KFL_004940020 [Klebsormidium nitens]|eukprot:GAQ89173.1 hypothetical protein KFL_004940020 [Klebsormidium nitens]